MPTQKSVGRRDFLRVLGARRSAGGGPPLLSRPGRGIADTETNDEKRKTRYKVSDDVKVYHRVNRYPS